MYTGTGIKFQSQTQQQQLSRVIKLKDKESLKVSINHRTSGAGYYRSWAGRSTVYPVHVEGTTEGTGYTAVQVQQHDRELVFIYSTDYRFLFGFIYSSFTCTCTRYTTTCSMT